MYLEKYSFQFAYIISLARISLRFQKQDHIPAQLERRYHSGQLYSLHKTLPTQNTLYARNANASPLS